MWSSYILVIGSSYALYLLFWNLYEKRELAMKSQHPLTKQEKKFLFKSSETLFQSIFDAYKIEDKEERKKTIRNIDQLDNDMAKFFLGTKNLYELNKIVSVSLKEEEGNKNIKTAKIRVISNQTRENNEVIDVIDVLVFTGSQENWKLVKVL